MFSPARLHFFFARDAPVGVIFRRGPSKQVRLILWRTDTDTFEAGQWLKGRIYGERAALSPDGKLLSYFAMDLRKQRLRPNTISEAEFAWIAISRPPYLTALALWFQRSTWNGDTAFPDNYTFLIGGHYAPATAKPAPDWLAVQNVSPYLKCLTYRGWLPVANNAEPRSEAARNPVGQIYEKRIQGEIASLEWRPATVSVEEHFRLRNRESGAWVLVDADYAEVDGTGRLILARDGRLFTARVTGDDLQMETTELYDFNEMTFEPIAPPDWATQWPSG